jgi:lipopolysaccharide export system protein LptA
MKSTLIDLAICTSILLGSAPAGALSSDRQQPISIEADWAEADNRKQVTVYKGGVVITQGSLHISGDTATIYYNDARDLTELFVEGQPARFRQRVDGKEAYQKATAKRMEYHAADNLVILLGDAHSWQGTDHISGDRIVFDTLNNRIQANTEPSSERDPESRVKITIVPKGQ